MAAFAGGLNTEATITPIRVDRVILSVHRLARQTQQRIEMPWLPRFTIAFASAITILNGPLSGPCIASLAARGLY